MLLCFRSECAKRRRIGQTSENRRYCLPDKLPYGIRTPAAPSASYRLRRGNCNCVRIYCGHAKTHVLSQRAATWLRRRTALPADKPGPTWEWKPLRISSGVRLAAPHESAGRDPDTIAEQALLWPVESVAKHDRRDLIRLLLVKTDFPARGTDIDTPYWPRHGWPSCTLFMGTNEAPCTLALLENVQPGFRSGST